MKTRAAVLLVAAALLLCGCAGRREAKTDFFAMDTHITLTAHGKNAEKAVAQARGEIERLDRLLSVTDSDSAVFAFNSGEEIDNTTVSEILAEAENLGDLTRGAYNPYLYPVLEAWGFYSGDYRVPDESELRELLAKTDQIDFGGIAKGYAADKTADIMRENGVESAIISLGGNIYAVGEKQNGDPWRVAVRDPFGSSEYAGVLLLRDISAVTSGGYERHFESEGAVFHHIIDPKTGYPADSGLASVTVIAKSSTLADGLSTGLFVLGYEQALEVWRENPGLFELVLIEDDGSVTITKGLGGRFECEREFIIITE